jgi:hypothetical protein
MGFGSDVATKVELCPRHYGVCLDEIFRGWNPDHNPAQVQRNQLTQRDLVRGQIMWMVKRGDVVLPNSPIKSSIKFESHVSRDQHARGVRSRVTFVATSLPDAPTNISELRNGKREDPLRCLVCLARVGSQ